MWADNETGVDPCGFVYHVDQLELVLTDMSLGPVTRWTNWWLGFGEVEPHEDGPESPRSG